MNQKSLHPLLLASCCLLLTACQQDPIQPVFDSIERPSTWTTQKLPEEALSIQPNGLLELVHTDELETLVNQALAANPDLQQTLLTLKVGQLELTKAKSNWWPNLQAGVSQSRGEGADASYRGSATANWEIDLWGSNLDSVNASSLDITQREALYQAARNTLIAQVSKAWLALTNQHHIIGFQTQRVDSLRKTESFIVQRFRNGLGTSEDLNSARTRRLQAEATLSNQQETLNQLKRGLLLLTGQTPIAQQLVSVAPDYPRVLLPIAGLPDQTLATRPDVQAAYAAAQAADKRKSVAYKNMLPSISIQGALQDSGDSPAQALFKDPVWTLLSQLTAPLFQAGALKAAAEQQSLNAASAYEAYRSTLLSAVQEVEDSLGQEATLAEQEALLEQALERANKNLEQYRRNYRSGLVTILDLLTVEQNTFDLQSQLDSVKYSRLSNRIDLGLALGLGEVSGETPS